MATPLESYLMEMREIRATGAGVRETSFYPALSNLLNEIGKELKPKVSCVMNLANTGAGIPDGGLFTADQIRKQDKEPTKGQLPARGAMEVKGLADDVNKIAESEQVKRYVNEYGVVLVTNYRKFLLIGRDSFGNPLPMESFSLADDEESFWRAAAHPRKMDSELGEQFHEYMIRVMQSNAPLTDPENLAWFLASYARDAKARIECHKDLSALKAVRDALEEALGMKFAGEKGDHFFRSTLVQTIFYGVFSSWTLWHRENPARSDSFDWRISAFSLHVPFIRALYEQVATPSRLGSLGIMNLLDWTASALNRVDRAAFFSKFQEEHAVQYFYEPFLEAFDPELRKELGVWYTPREIVQYQVARVDTVLREELGLEDGLADPSVVVLDPCCGTGAYLVETLKKIAETLKAKGDEALIASDLKMAARKRVFGFEILPAPFVVAHLQLGLMLHNLGAPLSSESDERVGVYLTNALTGWEPPQEPKDMLFPELQAERDAANHVKRDEKILVIIGNPPYNGYAGVAMEEERDLSTAYHKTVLAPKPQGQGLNDLYVRFFRMADRRIVEQTQRGVICFISNYSWLDGLSHTGMRERYINFFDLIFIDNLHGDRIISEYAPDGGSSDTVFAIQGHSSGIKIGTSISTLVKRKKSTDSATVWYRDFFAARADKRRADLKESLSNKGIKEGYVPLQPVPEIGLPFKPCIISANYLLWPKLPELIPLSFPGIKTSRDEFLVDIDRDRLEERLLAYFDRNVSHDEMRQLAPSAMNSTARFNAKSVREYLCKRGMKLEHIFRYNYRPMDVRWLYWEPETKLLDEKRSDYCQNVQIKNPTLVSQQRPRREWSPPQIISSLGCLDLMDRGATCFPLILEESSSKGDMFSNESKSKKQDSSINMSTQARNYFNFIGYNDIRVHGEKMLYYVVAILHSPCYRQKNTGALNMDWPRIPLPQKREALESSAGLGRRLAALLDTESDVQGVTSGQLPPIFRTIGALARVGGGPLNPDAGELEVTAGWGHAGKDNATMPGRGRLEERPYTNDELKAVAEYAESNGLSREVALSLLGETTCDVYLNDIAYWRNIPVNVWDYYIGGYQVIKKWLSYRESKLLGRPLRADDAREVTGTARRLAAIVLMQPALDENYQSVAEDTYPWGEKGE